MNLAMSKAANRSRRIISRLTAIPIGLLENNFYYLGGFGTDFKFPFSDLYDFTGSIRNSAQVES